MGRTARYLLEAFYKPSQEGIYVTVDGWKTETILLGRGDTGAWRIDVETYTLMGLLGDQSAFLAECL